MDHTEEFWSNQRKNKNPQKKDGGDEDNGAMELTEEVMMRAMAQQKTLKSFLYLARFVKKCLSYF